MSGSSGSSSPMNYVTGGLQTLGGAVATYFGAPEIGVPLMTSGVSQLAGGSGSSGGGAGGLGGAGSMLSQFMPGTPGASANPASAAQPSNLSQMTGLANSLAPAMQAAMNSMGLNRQQQGAAQPPAIPPQQPQQQPQSAPQTPAAQTLPTAVGMQGGGGAPSTGGLPTAVGMSGQQQTNPIQQILAMLGRGG